MLRDNPPLPHRMAMLSNDELEIIEFAMTHYIDAFSYKTNIAQVLLDEARDLTHIRKGDAI